ncbi:MAG: hypothetical protein V4628_07335, partial [Pseudomonadota bacterium]
MNQHKHHLVWLMLPAVIVALAFVVFQPGSNFRSTDSAIENLANGIPDAVPIPVQPETQGDSRGEDNSGLQSDPQTADGTVESSDEIAKDREFIEHAFPVLSSWNLHEVKPLLAETTIAASTDEELSEVMSVLQDRLGDLKYFETPQPIAMEGEEESLQAADGKLQHYHFIAYYEAGEAEINLIL